MSEKKQKTKRQTRPLPEKREVKYAFWDSIKMIINAIIIGFALLIATMLYTPILEFVASLGIEPPELAFVFTIIFLLVIMIVFGLLLIPINRQVQKYKNKK